MVRAQHGVELWSLESLFGKIVETLVHLAVMAEHLTFELMVEQVLDFRKVEERHSHASVLALLAREYALKTAHVAVVDNGAVAVGQLYVAFLGVLRKHLLQGELLVGNLNVHASLKKIDAG